MESNGYLDIDLKHIMIVIFETKMNEDKTYERINEKRKLSSLFISLMAFDKIEI